MVASIQHALWLSSFFVILAISSADRTTTDFDLKPGGMVQNVKHEKVRKITRTTLKHCAKVELCSQLSSKKAMRWWQIAIG